MNKQSHLSGLSYIRRKWWSLLLVSRGREWIAPRHVVSVRGQLDNSSRRQGERQDPVKGGVPRHHCCTMSPHSTPLCASLVTSHLPSLSAEPRIDYRSNRETLFCQSIFHCLSVFSAPGPWATPLKPQTTSHP